MNISEDIIHLRKRPTMLGVGHSVESTTSWLLGYDAAGDSVPLRGLREWLVMRLGYGTNLGWPVLMANLCTEPDELQKVLRHEIADNDELIRSKMFDLLEEFIRDRETRGADAIVDEYTQWKAELEATY